jgi:hypothetical protein
MLVRAISSYECLDIFDHTTKNDATWPSLIKHRHCKEVSNPAHSAKFRAHQAPGKKHGGHFARRGMSGCMNWN